MVFLYFKNEPGATMHRVEAESKAEAKKKIEEKEGIKFKFGDCHSIYHYELVTARNYYNYNFSKFSYLVKK